MAVIYSIMLGFATILYSHYDLHFIEGYRRYVVVKRTLHYTRMTDRFLSQVLGPFIDNSGYLELDGSIYLGSDIYLIISA